MAGIVGMKWGTRETTERVYEVASALDDLTEQLRVANQMKAAEILKQQGGIDDIEYSNFLQGIFWNQ